MGAGSVFRVGEDVDLGQMLLNFTALAVALMLFEKALHTLEHKAARYPKYRDMINKVYRELMILGLIGLAIKMAKEAGVVDDSSAEMTAFLSADLAIFFMAIALIVQAICIFVQLRNKNKQIDVLELFTSEDLFLLASSHERNQRVQRNPLVWIWSANKYDQLMSMRLTRHLFLQTHGLPELFPFTKYLRQAQDSQIRHMIDVEPSTWLVVFLMAWLWYTSVTLLVQSGWFHHPDDLDANNQRTDRKLASNQMSAASIATTRDAVAVVFMFFVWSLTIAHGLTAVYLRWCRRRILQYAGVSSRAQMISRLKEIALEEATNLSREVTSEAMQKMLQVEEHQQLAQHKRHQHDHDEHDPGIQLLKNCWRSARTKSKTSNNQQNQQHQQNQQSSTPTHQLVGELKLPFFSRGWWHFWIMLLLILNGLYLAFFCQIVLHYMGSFVTDYGLAFAVFLPSPILINMVMQTHMIRDFVLVGSIWRVSVTTLSEVIEDFTEVVEMQTNFISQVHDCLVHSGPSVDQLHQLLETNDFNQTGWLDVEELRQVLASIGFHMSFFRFNGVMKLLFQLRQLKVDYRKVITLLKLAEHHHTSPTPHDNGIPLAASVDTDGLKPSLSASSTAVRLRRSIERMDAVPTTMSSVGGLSVASQSQPLSRVLIHDTRVTLHDALMQSSSRFVQQLAMTNVHWQSSMAHTHRERPRATRDAAFYYTHGQVAASGEHQQSAETSPFGVEYLRM